MIATQNYAREFHDFPATGLARPEARRDALIAGRGAGMCLLTSVIIGVVEAALETARRQLERKRDSMCACEQTEWSRIAREGWLIQQTYEDMPRTVEKET